MPQIIARITLVVFSSLITISIVGVLYLENKTSFSITCKFPELASSPLPPLVSDSDEDDSIYYQTDAFGRRLEPFESKKDIKNKLLVFGGSTAWGYGLTEDKTLSAVVTKDSKETRAYNYACPACGPKFYILFYPTPNDKFYKNLSVNLSNDIKVLKYEKLFSLTDQQYILPENKHPSPIAIKRISSQLIRDLNL